MISYDHFAQLDIRLGKVLSVEVVEGADKLLRCMVDIGEETPRQIVSGIRQYLTDPQSLVGKTFPYLVNLEPRVIRGIESQGMILAAATESGDFAFLEPSVSLPPGTRLR